MTIEKDLINAVERLVKTYLYENLNTCTIGRIESYDPDKRRARVTPVISKKYANGEVSQYQPIEDIPVMFLQTTKATIKIPVKKGDFVLLLFTQRPIDNWKYKGGIVEPDDTRKFDITDAIAIPGILPFNISGVDSGDNEDIEIIHEKANIILKSSGEMLLENDNCSIEVGTSLVKINGDNLTVGA